MQCNNPPNFIPFPTDTTTLVLLMGSVDLYFRLQGQLEVWENLAAIDDWCIQRRQQYHHHWPTSSASNGDFASFYTE